MPFPMPWAEIADGLGGGFRPGEVTTIAGQAGNGKSFIALTVCYNLQLANIPWRYLPLEDNAGQVTRRMSALLFDDWKMIDMDYRKASEQETKIVKNLKAIHSLSRSICQNPRKWALNPNTKKPYLPDVPWSLVCDWVGALAETSDAKLIVVDPVKQIDFDEPTQPWWRVQEKFVRTITAMADRSGVHVILVNHLRGRSGKDRKESATMEDMGGSAAFRDLVHNVLLLEAHDEKTSAIVVNGDLSKANYKRTLSIEKCRNGSGRALRFAMDFTSPYMACLGQICKEK